MRFYNSILSIPSMFPSLMIFETNDFSFFVLQNFSNSFNSNKNQLLIPK